MSNDRPKYEKIFSRDFCLPALEAWYRGETTQPKQWTDEKQPCFPYIVFERSDGTVACFYDFAGAEWMKDLLRRMARADSDFIPMLERTIPEKLKDVQPIYEEQRVLDRGALIRFMAELEEYYPWFEGMWWFMEMTDEELDGLDVSGLRELRAKTNDLSTGTDIVIRKSLQALYPDIRDLTHVLRVEEIVSNELPPVEELKRRDAGYFYTADKIFVGTTKKDIDDTFNIELVEAEVPQDVQEIKGATAQGGRTRGKVRRVMGHKEIHLLQEGEILVAPMTMPDFLPAMKKSAAIVTDEGGIACHAAIVARELKKPCVTGTKIATQVLKDGDVVEVDADAGIIRKLAP